MAPSKAFINCRPNQKGKTMDSDAHAEIKIQVGSWQTSSDIKILNFEEFLVNSKSELEILNK